MSTASLSKYIFLVVFNTPNTGLLAKCGSRGVFI
jgi:hypothetical protein